MSESVSLLSCIYCLLYIQDRKKLGPVSLNVSNVSVNHYVDTQKNCIVETIGFSTNNICENNQTWIFYLHIILDQLGADIF